MAVDDKVKDIVVVAKEAEVASYNPQSSLEAFVGGAVQGAIFPVWVLNFYLPFEILCPPYSDSIRGKIMEVQRGYERRYPCSADAGFTLGVIWEVIIESIGIVLTPTPYVVTKIITNTLGYLYYRNKLLTREHMEVKRDGQEKVQQH